MLAKLSILGIWQRFEYGLLDNILDNIRFILDWY